jgi:hypothetical protein
VKATQPGPEANVDANAITIPPSTYNPNVIKVTNPQPTTGGARQTFPVVVQKDVDAAQAALRKLLSSELDAQLGQPNAVPAGATLFPATKQVSAPAPDVDPATLVGQQVATFELTLTATGTAIAVDESPLQQVAAQRLVGSVRADHTLIDGSIEVQPGAAAVSGQTVSFPVDASASQVVRIDAASLRDAIRGRSVGDARRILAQYGTVDITTWPGWASSIPTIDQRLDLTVATPASVGASGAPAPSASGPAASASSAPSGPASPRSPGSRAPSPSASGT